MSNGTFPGGNLRGLGDPLLWRKAVAALALAIAMLIPFAVATSPAQAQSLRGELQCAPLDKLQYIWMLGSRSGWHGYDYGERPPYSGTYSIPNAVRGETMQVWMGCMGLGKYYTSFPVGRGSVRHICSTSDWGLVSMCGSTNIGACAIRVAFTGLNIGGIACFVRNL